MLGTLLFLVFIRNINSKYRGGFQVMTLEYLLDVLRRKWLQIAVLTSTPGPLLLTVKQCFHQHPLTNTDLQDSHPQLLRVCVDGWASVTGPPSLRGGIVSKHAEYRLESDANQFLSYATPDLWWTLWRWMLPRLSIEISGPQQQEHISYGFPAPACYLRMNK